MEFTMRPGVYTDYTITPVYAKNKGRPVGIAAQCPGKAGLGLQRVVSLGDAVRLFGEAGEDNILTQMLGVLFSVASPVVYALPVDGHGTDDYRQALDQLAESGAYLVVTDCKEKSVYEYMAQALLPLEKLGICGCLDAEAPDVTAKALNCRRICLTAPAVRRSGTGEDMAPVLLAGMISAKNDVSHNLNGESVQGGYYIGDEMDEDTVEQYLKSGVCVFEQASESIELIRGMTTATMDENGQADYTYRNISVALTVDTVVPALREALRERLRTAKGNQAGLNSILSLLYTKLGDYVDTGILSDYDMPRVYLDEDDPSVCIAEIGFVVAQGIHSIYLTAHISV